MRKTVVRTLACAALVAAVPAWWGAGEAIADPRGVWLTDSGKSHVRLDACEDDRRRLCGEIVWLRKPTYEDGSPRLDRHNDDKALRSRPLIGLRVLWDLEDQGGGEWDDGEIYNPEDGEIYDSELEEIDGSTLEVRGCVWFICKTQTWTRVE